MTQPKIWGAILLPPVQDPVLECTCDPTAQHLAKYNVLPKGVVVHIAGCPVLFGRLFNVVHLDNMCLDRSAKPAKILTQSGQPWVPKQVPKRKRIDRQAASNYKIVLQFLFHRPININLWKTIKPPRGWRKCPTNVKGQLQYCSVRFQCRDMKYTLTPDEIEELRARLYLCLETVF